MKTAYLGLIAVVAVAAAVLGYWGLNIPEPAAPIGGSGECTYSQMNYYYRDTCGHCIQVANDGSLEKLEGLGVQVEKREVVNWGMWDIYQTPTFEFGGQRVAGYRSFEQLKELLGCNA